MWMKNILQHSCNFSKISKTQNVLLNITQVRYRQPVYFRKYNQPNYRKKLLLAVCEPFEALDRRPPSEKCFNLTPPIPKSDHPYDVLLAKDMHNEMNESQLVCFFHQNQMHTYDKKALQNELQHQGLFLRYYNRDIARICLKNTKFEPLLHFAPCYDFTVLFAPDTTKITRIIKIEKKYPEVHLLGALVGQRRLVNVKQLEELSKMPDLNQQRAILLHTLNMPQRSILQNLSYHTSDLSKSLDSHAKGNMESNDFENNNAENNNLEK